MMFQHIFCDNISIYDETIALNYDKISLFVLKTIDNPLWMMYACNGFKYHGYVVLCFLLFLSRPGIACPDAEL